MGSLTYINGVVNTSRQSIIDMIINKPKECDFEDLELFASAFDLTKKEKILLSASGSVSFSNVVDKNGDYGRLDYDDETQSLRVSDLFSKNNRFDWFFKPLSKFKDNDVVDILLYRYYGTPSGMWILTKGDYKFRGDDYGNPTDLMNAICDLIPDAHNRILNFFQKELDNLSQIMTDNLKDSMKEK